MSNDGRGWGFLEALTLHSFSRDHSRQSKKQHEELINALNSDSDSDETNIQVQRSELEAKMEFQEKKLNTFGFIFYTFIFGMLQPVTFVSSMFLHILDPKWLINNYLPTSMVSMTITFCILFPMSKIKATWGLYYEYKDATLFKIFILVNTLGFFLSIGFLDAISALVIDYVEFVSRVGELERRIQEAQDISYY